MSAPISSVQARSSANHSGGLPSGVRVIWSVSESGIEAKPRWIHGKCFDWVVSLPKEQPG